MRMLILGASGFLGRNLYDYFKNKGHEVYGTCFRKEQEHLNIKIDLTKSNKLESVINLIEPDLIINSLRAGGHTNNDIENLYNINHLINKRIKDNFKGRLVYFSSEWVFDGTKGDYTEEDKPNPINSYGKSKVKGELECNVNDLIIRLGTLYYGLNGGYVKYVYDSIRNKEQIDCWEDIIGPISYIPNVCFELENLINNNSKGIFHLVNENINKYEFANKIAEAYNLDNSFIKKVRYNGEMIIPKNTSMKSVRLDRKFKLFEETI